MRPQEYWRVARPCGSRKLPCPLHQTAECVSWCGVVRPKQETVIGVKYGEWGRNKYGTAKGKVDAVEVCSS